MSSTNDAVAWNQQGLPPGAGQKAVIDREFTAGKDVLLDGSPKFSFHFTLGITGVDPGDGQEKQAWHPLVRPHPVSGRDTLYLTTPARCAEIEGMDADETAETVAALHAHSTAPENCLRHTWAPGDVVMWDNGTVLHAADHSGVVGDRVMHRGMATGYGDPVSGTLSE